MIKKKTTKYLEQCPFFIKTEVAGSARRISCESPVPGSTIFLYFRSHEDYHAQHRIFCCEHYRKCEIYRAVMEKYDA